MRFHLAAVLLLSIPLLACELNAQHAARVYVAQYSSDTSPICSATLDGADEHCFTMSYRPRVVAVDWSSSPQKLYIGLVSTSGAGKIVRCNTDGTDTVDVVTNTMGVTDIELDLTHRVLYWLQNTWGDDRIYHAEMDGCDANVTQIYATTVTNRDLWGLALDVTNQRLWITERGSTCYDSQIRRMSFSGGGVTYIRSPACNPHDIEYFNGRIYWWERVGICSARGDGSDVDTIYLGGMVVGLAINGTDGSIYWTDGNHYDVRRINPDGTGETNLLANHGGFYSIDVDYNPSAVPVEAGFLLPEAYELSACYPNPFNAEASMELRLPAAAHVRLALYDLLGREVRVVLEEWKEAGVHPVRLDGSLLATGAYLCRLQVNGFVQTRRLLLLR